MGVLTKNNVKDCINIILYDVKKYLFKVLN
jgi:hypothetical protein